MTAKQELASECVLRWSVHRQMASPIRYLKLSSVWDFLNGHMCWVGQICGWLPVTQRVGLFYVQGITYFKIYWSQHKKGLHVELPEVNRIYVYVVYYMWTLPTTNTHVPLQGVRNVGESPADDMFDSCRSFVTLTSTLTYFFWVDTSLCDHPIDFW